MGKRTTSTNYADTPPQGSGLGRNTLCAQTIPNQTLNKPIRLSNTGSSPNPGPPEETSRGSEDAAVARRDREPDPGAPLGATTSVGSVGSSGASREFAWPTESSSHPNCFKGHRVVETPLPRQAHPQIRRGPCMSAYPARKIVCACSPV